MAFIKRSIVTSVNAKVGKRMLKCSSCGKPFVSKALTNLCQNCIPKTVSTNEDGSLEERTPDFPELN